MLLGEKHRVVKSFVILISASWEEYAYRFPVHAEVIVINSVSRYRKEFIK